MKRARASSVLRLLVAIAALGAAGAIALFRARGATWTMLSGEAATHLMELSAPCFDVHRSLDPAKNRIVMSKWRRDLWSAKEPDTFSLTPASGTFRIAVIGESSALGVAEGVTAGAWRNDAVEVLDCASGGPTLPYVEKRWAEMRRYSPRAVVIMFGHGMTQDLPSISPPQALVNKVLSAFDVAMVTLNPKIADTPIALALESAALESFYRRAADEAKAADRALMLCTIPPNWMYPPEITGDPYPIPYLEAQYLYWTGRRGEAENALEPLIAGNDGPRFQFLSGIWRVEDGDLAGAGVRLREASRRFNRSVWAANPVIRRVAADRGVPLLDAEDFVLRRAPDGIPGWSLFIGIVHLKRSAYRALGQEAVRRLAGPEAERSADPYPLPAESADYFMHQLLEEELPSAENDEDEWATPVEFMVWDHLRHGGAAARGDFAAWFAKLEIPSARYQVDPQRIRGDVLVAGARAFWRAGDRDEAQLLCRRAMNESPKHADAHLQGGLFLLALGRPGDAAAEFQEALKRDPKRPDAAYFLKRAGGAAPSPRRPSN